MKTFFTELDCDYYLHMNDPAVRGTPCAISLDKANRLLSERGKVIYKQPGWCGHSWQENLHDAGNRTHTALLINIEPIEQDSAEKVLRDLIAIDDKFLMGHIPPSNIELPAIIDRARKLVAK